MVPNQTFAKYYEMSAAGSPTTIGPKILYRLKSESLDCATHMSFWVGNLNLLGAAQEPINHITLSFRCICICQSFEDLAVHRR